jgi:hypothetical protein
LGVRASSIASGYDRNVNAAHRAGVQIAGKGAKVESIGNYT